MRLMQQDPEAWHPSMGRGPCGVLKVVGGEIEPVIEPEVAESGETKQFSKANQLLERKAREFWGLWVAGASETSQMRILYKALSEVMHADPVTNEWRKNFEAVPALKRGQDYQKRVIRYGDEVGMSHKVEAGTALQQPSLRTAVLDKINLEARAETGHEDSALHVIDFLTEWRSEQREQPSYAHANMGDRTLEKFLFSVHGPTIVATLESQLGQNS